MTQRIPELPLLRRELTELANRRRTYIVRVVGACILLLFVFLAYQAAIADRLRFAANGVLFGPSKFLGVGGHIFSRIVPYLFYSIQLLMPALCCAAITAEKEKNTFGTLLLTKLSPGTIILEKVGSRMIPMLTILLLTFPVLAHIHSLGGVDTQMLGVTIWLLISECVLMASIAIMFSSWFATTVAAFIWSYILTGFLLVLSLSLEVSTFVPSALWRELYYGDMRMAAMWPGPMAGMGVTPQQVWLKVIIWSIPAWLVAGFFLLVSRLVIVRRAFATQSSVLLKFFRVVDRFFQWLNERTTGGIEITRDSNPLPDDDPVAWRERAKKSLGKARYLFRMLMVLEVPTMIVCLLAASISAQRAFGGLYVLQAIIWVLVALITAVKGATLFSSERSKETIEALLATPMTGRQILDEKIRGTRRLLIVLALPVLTINLTHFMMNIDVVSMWGRDGNREALGYLLAGLVSVITIGVSAFVSGPKASDRAKRRARFALVTGCLGCLPTVRYMLITDAGPIVPFKYIVITACSCFVLLNVITWITTWLGMVIHSQTKAVTISVAFIATWTVLPIIAATLLPLAGNERELLLTLTPYCLIEAGERYLNGTMILGAAWNYTDQFSKEWWMYTVPVYTALLILMQILIRLQTPWLLSRRESPETVPRNSPMPAGISALEASSS